MENIAYKRQLFLVSLDNIRVIIWATGREDAKRQAKSWLRGDADSYIVSPLSESGDKVHLAIMLTI
jgi:hypothetical protein